MALNYHYNLSELVALFPSSCSVLVEHSSYRVTFNPHLKLDNPLKIIEDFDALDYRNERFYLFLTVS